ncbi:MAG TPA: class I SAM-dependent methyltransferase [Sphingomicrobium sp.]|nr:class I SAM-dependent methyltransferase [Sphingomicrobium sp.]
MFDSYADIFSERAGLYHRAMAAFPLARRSEFEAMVSPLAGRDSGSLCDLPSGGGYLSPYLPAGWRYTAVEPTDAFAELCRLEPGQDLVRSPLTAVPRPDASFDAVISLAGLHHEHDKLAIMREAARLLRPGGVAVIADVAAGSNEDSFLNGFVDANSQMGHHGEFLDEQFARDVEAAGFEISGDALVATPWRFDSRADAAAFATDLFGVSAGPQEVERALAATVGLEDRDDGVAVTWHLRRLVCTLSSEEADE